MELTNEQWIAISNSDIIPCNTYNKCTDCPFLRTFHDKKLGEYDNCDYNFYYYQHTSKSEPYKGDRHERTN